MLAHPGGKVGNALLHDRKRAERGTVQKRVAHCAHPLPGAQGAKERNPLAHQRTNCAVGTARVLERAPVRAHDPFGTACRPRGVDDEGQVIRVCDDFRAVLPATRENLVAADHVIGLARDSIRELIVYRIGHDQQGRRILQHLPEARRWIGRVEHDDRSSALQHAEHGGDERRVVPHE